MKIKCGYCGKEIKYKKDYGYFSIFSGLIDSNTGSSFKFHQSCHIKRGIKDLEDKIKNDTERIEELKLELKTYE